LQEKDKTEVSQVRQAFADAGPDDDEASLRERMKKAEKALADHRAELSAKRDALVALRTRLSETPRQLQEPVYDTREYPVIKVTRTAKAKVKLHARSDEGQVLVKAATVEGEATTEDTTNKAMPRFGVKADPLAFPTSDAELTDNALDAATAKVASRLGDFCKRWQGEVLGRARQAASSAELEATEDFVLYLSIDPGQPPADLVQFLKEKKGLDDVGALRSRPTP